MLWSEVAAFKSRPPDAGGAPFCTKRRIGGRPRKFRPCVGWKLLRRAKISQPPGGKYHGVRTLYRFTR